MDDPFMLLIRAKVTGFRDIFPAVGGKAFAHTFSFEGCSAEVNFREIWQDATAAH
jgi:hypothetical protein